MTKISFHCYSRSGAAPHLITFDTDSYDLSCDCNFFKKTGFCSHIDATILSYQIGMVPEDEWDVVNKLTDKIIKDTLDNEFLKNKIIERIPKNWLASWRFDRKWRRIDTIRESWENKKETKKANSLLYREKSKESEKNTQ